MQLDTEWRTSAGSIGKLLPNMQARLVLDDGEVDAATSEAGEIWVKGPSIMKVGYVVIAFSYPLSVPCFTHVVSTYSKGYLNNPEATLDAITPDGWFKTGDIAVVDNQGNFKIVDRKKELIKYKVVAYFSRRLRLNVNIRASKVCKICCRYIRLPQPDALHSRAS
jgi:4-coumarate--CoA ligase